MTNQHQASAPQNEADLTPASPLLSKSEAAAYLAISTRTLERIQQDHVIPYVQIGKRQLYLVRDLDSFINANRKI
jgi:excisionase family DNA binding protein